MQVETGPMCSGFFTFVGHAQVGLHPSKNLVVLASPWEDAGGVNDGGDTGDCTSAGAGAGDGAGDGAGAGAGAGLDGLEGVGEVPGLHCQ